MKLLEKREKALKELEDFRALFFEGCCDCGFQASFALVEGRSTYP